MMRKCAIPVLSVFLASVLCLALLGPSPARAAKKAKVLYITTTAGFHHDTCEYSVPIIKKIAEDSGAFEVVASEKTDLITPQGLKEFDAIVFSNTTGDLKQFPLSEENRDALIDAVKDGKAFIGIHAATDTYKDWPPFAEMIGGSFNGHPWNESVTINLEDPSSPAASPCPSPWTIADEIYTFKNWSREKMDVIMSLDKGSEKGKGNRPDGDYALAWCKTFGKGNVFYTALGHRKEVWDDPTFQAHLLGGIRWALGQAEADIHPGHRKVEDTKWVKLFDGEHLDFGTDWETTDKASETRKHWTVQPGGILQGAAAPGTPTSSHLYYTKKKFKDFEYRAKVCIIPGGNSGMYFRCLDSNKSSKGEWKNWPDGYEAQVNNDSADERRSGTCYPEPSIHEKDLERLIGYNVAKEKSNKDYWFTQEVIAVGDHVVIKLNGKVAVDVPDLKKLAKKPYSREGFFAYQFHDNGTVVKYKDIEVRELP